jgi:hypothetical protein
MSLITALPSDLLSLVFCTDRFVTSVIRVLQLLNLLRHVDEIMFRDREYSFIVCYLPNSGNIYTPNRILYHTERD